IRWRGYDLACDWMPGQTEFACCVHGVIDGKRVAFTGDNIFGSPSDPAQHGHEAVSSRNACTVEEGYGFAGDYLHGIAPDLILGGHSWAIENPKPLIDRYISAAAELRDSFRDLTGERDYRLGYDPYWVRVHPYRVNVKPGDSAEATVIVRTFLDVPTVYELKIVCPPGIRFDPSVATLRVEAGGSRSLPVRVSAAADAAAGLSLVAIDITQDGVRRGQLFDVIVNVTS
ncbi:MAG: hypothetical protein ACKOHG_15745, partial [Planctomycetia bacterium]